MEFPELGIYTLPGHTEDPCELYDEVREAEALGLGSCWVSERFDVKEATACAGAMAALTKQIIIGTAATNSYTRHPQITAAAGSTLNRLSKGRFAFGFARGIGVRNGMMGLENASNAELADFVAVMRRLWKGERVVGHRGPIGDYPYLHCASWLDEDIPLFIVAFGRRSLAFVGRVFDGVILHTFMSDAAVERAVALVRKGAEEAGRDPADVKIYSLLATGCNASEERQLKLLTARMGTYLQAPGYGELLVEINDWDPAILKDFRASDVVSSMPGGIDQVATIDQLREIRDLIPEQWLPAAVGDPETCAKRFVDQFDAGADGIVVHGCTPKEFAPMLDRMASEGDILHGNTVTFLDHRSPAASPIFGAGRILTSAREIDLIAVVDLEEKRALWARQGPCKRQHEPLLLDDGRLLIFDNQGGTEGRSRILEIDPTTGEILWRFEHPLFASPQGGTAERLPGGHTLITSTEQGRAFEVTAGGEVVWEFVSPHRGGKDNDLVASLWEMIRLDEDFDPAVFTE